MPLRVVVFGAALLLSATARGADDRPGAIAGRVVDTRSGSAVAPATVMLFPAAGAPTTRTTDAAGTFRFGQLRPGSYTLVTFFGDATVRKDGVVVEPDRDTAVVLAVDMMAGAEVVTIKERRPGKVVPPEPISRTVPRILPYSDEAIQENTWGVAWLLLHIDERGAVTDVKLLKGPGKGLDEIAVAIARKFRFSPATDAGGRPIAVDYIYIMEWPSFWPTVQGWKVMTPPCKGEGPMNLGSVNVEYRDCEPPPGLSHLRLKQPRGPQ